MEIGSQPLISTSAPIKSGEGVARLLSELPAGTRAIATVAALLGENAYLLKLDGASVRAQGPAGLVAGQVLTLEVVTQEGVPHLKIVPPALPRNAEAAAIREAFRQFLPQRRPLEGLASNLQQALDAGLPSNMPQGLAGKLAAVLDGLPRLAQLIQPDGLKRAAQNSGLFFEAKAAGGAFAGGGGSPATDDFKGNLLALAQSLRAGINADAANRRQSEGPFAAAGQRPGQDGEAVKTATGAKPDAAAPNPQTAQAFAAPAQKSSPQSAQNARPAGSGVSAAMPEAGHAPSSSESATGGEKFPAVDVRGAPSDKPVPAADPARTSGESASSTPDKPTPAAQTAAGIAEKPAGDAADPKKDLAPRPGTSGDSPNPAAGPDKPATASTHGAIPTTAPNLAPDSARAAARQAESATDGEDAPADDIPGKTGGPADERPETRAIDDAGRAERGGAREKTPVADGDRRALAQDDAPSGKPVERAREEGRPADDGSADVRALLHKTEGALAKLALDQLASLPSNDNGPQIWRMEIPFFAADGRADTLKLKFSKESPARPEKGEETWSVLLELNPPGLGPVHGRVALRGGRVDAWLWGDRPDTTRLIRAHLEALAARLRQVGVETGRLEALEQAPPNLFDNAAPLSNLPLLSERA